MNQNDRVTILETLIAMAEIAGRTITPAAAKIFADDLSHLDTEIVLKSLARCRKELRTFPTIADVLARAQALDGRPGVEEAWAMLPKSEDDTVVWTEEMAEAFRVCRGLIEDGDHVAARMAFKEAYIDRVQRARDTGTPPIWRATLGHDKEMRRVVIEEAVRLGQLPSDQALKLLPDMTAQDPKVKQLVGSVIKALPNMVDR